MLLNRAELLPDQVKLRNRVCQATDSVSLYTVESLLPPLEFPPGIHYPFPPFDTIFDRNTIIRNISTSLSRHKSNRMKPTSPILRHFLMQICTYDRNTINENITRSLSGHHSTRAIRLDRITTGHNQPFLLKT